MNDTEKILLEASLKIVAEKYVKLMQQRSKATMTWNNKNKDKINEYSRNYQRRLYAKKKEARANQDNNIINNDAEYKKYQALYRATKYLRKLPFFGIEQNRFYQ